MYEALRVLEAASTSHVIIACRFQKLDCFKERCLRYCLKIVHLKLFIHFHCVSIKSRLSLLVISPSDWSDLGYCTLIGHYSSSGNMDQVIHIATTYSGHRLGQFSPLRPLETLLARPGPCTRPRSPHGLYVLQKLGQPVLGALIILTQDTVSIFPDYLTSSHLETVCECLILQLIRQTLAQRLAGPGVVREAEVTSDLVTWIV